MENMSKKNQFLGLGIALGMLPGYILSFIISISIDKPAMLPIIGAPIGVGFGFVINAFLEKKYHSDPEIFNSKNIKKYLILSLSAGIILLAGIVFFSFFN